MVLNHKATDKISAKLILINIVSDVLVTDNDFPQIIFPLSTDTSGESSLLHFALVCFIIFSYFVCLARRGYKINGIIARIKSSRGEILNKASSHGK